ncbi:MAG TPA: radical SAM protein [Phycisphaerae bacterium]|nr:radical SAM protein [Phycisphaerae bacterium]
MKHVFGPVPSRRLGRSLGIDLVPFKTCSYDCIYCQLGRTTCKTVERREWVRWEPLLEELKRRLDARPDYITFSGSGEPTLHAGLGELIDRIKSITSVPIAVLTNGSLLWRADVRRDLRDADLVIPSLDAGDDLHFRCVNRPHESLSFEQVVEGLIAFRDGFDGQYWLEVLVVSRWTSGRGHMEKIATWARKIRPDRVQLNTVSRPPAEPWAERVRRKRLLGLARLFEPRAEVIDEYTQPPTDGRPGSGADRICDTIRRRPCTLEDVMAAHGLHRNEAVKYLDELVRGGFIERVASGSDFYYRAIRPTEAGHVGATSGDDV